MGQRRTPGLSCGYLRQSSLVSAVGSLPAPRATSFRLGSNRGIKALHLCPGFCAQLHVVVFLCGKSVSDEIRFKDLRARFAGFFRPTFPWTFPNRGRSGAVHGWINVGSQCGELRLVKPFLPSSPPPFSVFPPPFAVFWDTIGTQYPKTATSERWGVAVLSCLGSGFVGMGEVLSNVAVLAG